MARKARSLDTLLGQITARWPNRKTTSDGWIGDAAHARRKSDHNPNAAGVVRAIDVTHDPASGADAQQLADELLASRDPRIKYVIHNRRIFSSPALRGKTPWQWRPYSGSHPHDKHVHISVVEDAALHDDPAPWSLDGSVAPPVAVAPLPPADTSWHQRFCDAVIKWEAKVDKSGRIVPHSTSGGLEIAGITAVNHPRWAAALQQMLNVGDDAGVRREVSRFIIEFTDEVRHWGVTNPGVELYLRDCFFNRGQEGAAKILQMALGVDVDGDIGPETRRVLAANELADPDDLLIRLRKAREDYEIAKYGKRSQYWTGLTNRWNAMLALAQEVNTGPVVVLPEPKPGSKTKREGGLWVIAVSVLGGVAAQFLPQFGDEAAWTEHLKIGLPLAGAGIGGLITWFGQRFAKAPIAGTPEAKAIEEARRQLEDLKAKKDREIKEAEDRMPPGVELPDPDDPPVVSERPAEKSLIERFDEAKAVYEALLKELEAFDDEVYKRISAARASKASSPAPADPAPEPLRSRVHSREPRGLP